MMTFSKNLMTSTVLFSGFLFSSQLSFAADTAKVIKEIVDTINKQGAGKGQDAVCKSYGVLRQDDGNRCEDANIAMLAFTLCNSDDFKKSSCAKKAKSKITDVEALAPGTVEEAVKKDPQGALLCQVMRDKLTPGGLALAIANRSCGDVKPDTTNISSAKEKISATASAAKEKISSTASAAKEKIKDLISKTSTLIKQLKANLSKSKNATTKNNTNSTNSTENADRITAAQIEQLETLTTNLENKKPENLKIPNTVELINAYDTIKTYFDKYKDNRRGEMTRAEGEELIAAYETILKS